MLAKRNRSISGTDQYYSATVCLIQGIFIMLKPNIDDIICHLWHLYESESESNRLFEIRCLHPTERRSHSRRFFCNESGLTAATRYASNMAVDGYNVYSIPNLLAAGTASDANDTNVELAHYHFVDFDEGDLETFMTKIQDCGFPQSFSVTTGTKPSQRMHVSWRMEPITDLTAWTDMQKRLADYFDTDRTIHNPSRLMRIGGTISYPPQRKIDRGYMTELTKLHVNQDDTRIDNNVFYGYFPPVKEAPQADKPSYAGDSAARGDAVPLEVLDAAFAVIPTTAGVKSPKSRKIWLDFGFAAKEANPTSGGRAWDNWAQRDPSQYDSQDQANTWATLKPSKITRGTIFRAANQADKGWWRDGAIVESWWISQAKLRSGDDTPDDAQTVFDPTVKWPGGFTMKHDGLWYLQPPRKDADEPPVLTWVCDPFKVLGRTSNEHNAEHGLALQFAEHEIIIPNDLIHIEGGVKLASLLALLGLTIGVGKYYRGLLQTGLGGVHTTRKIRSVKTTGWHKTADNKYIFMMPDKTYIGSDKDMLLAATPKYRFTQNGSLQEWQDNVVKYAAGNSRLTAFLCAAFVSPLINIIPSAENSGLGLDGVSRGGKTSALSIAASVWGKGDKDGCQQTWLATGVAMEYMATESCDCPLFLDEIQSADGRSVESMLYALGNGVGKARGQKDGGYKAGETWRIFLLSTGEMTPARKVFEDTGKQPMDGMVARLPTLPADAGMGMKIYENLHGFNDGAELSDQIRQATIKFYGSAIRPYLEKLVEIRNDGVDELLKQYVTFTQAFKKRNLPSNSDGIGVSVVESFARDAFAGKLAQDVGVLPSTIDPVWALERVCAAYFKEGGKALDGTKVTVVKDVRRFIIANLDSRFKDAQKGMDDHAPILRDIVGYKDHKGFYIVPELMNEMGHAENKIKKALDDDGFLRKDGPRFKVKKNLDGQQMTVYHILSTILEGEPD
jgi:hypothetical protein